MKDYTWFRNLESLKDYLNLLELNGTQDGIRDCNNDKGIWLKVTDDGMESVILSNKEKEENNEI